MLEIIFVKSFFETNIFNIYFDNNNVRLQLIIKFFFKDYISSHIYDYSLYLL